MTHTRMNFELIYKQRMGHVLIRYNRSPLGDDVLHDCQQRREDAPRPEAAVLVSTVDRASRISVFGSQAAAAGEAAAVPDMLAVNESSGLVYVTEGMKTPSGERLRVFIFTRYKLEGETCRYAQHVVPSLGLW